MVEDVYRKELQQDKREMQITLIRQSHPVYSSFNFSAFSDLKVEEMYNLLVVQGHSGGKDTEVQTKV